MPPLEWLNVSISSILSDVPLTRSWRILGVGFRFPVPGSWDDCMYGDFCMHACANLQEMSLSPGWYPRHPELWLMYDPLIILLLAVASEWATAEAVSSTRGFSGFNSHTTVGPVRGRCVS